jgi:D-proline reductase (dithiol) PrdB
VGLIARAVEEGGIPTISLSSARDITESVKPPRSVFINFPLGHTSGKPFDRPLQMKIIKDAFNALKSIGEPGTIVDLPYHWQDEDDSWEQKASV